MKLLEDKDGVLHYSHLLWQFLLQGKADGSLTLKSLGGIWEAPKNSGTIVLYVSVQKRI